MEDKSKQWWKRPFVWAGGVVLTAVGAGVGTWLAPQITESLNRATQTGPPVEVVHSDIWSEEGDVSLSNDVRLTDSDLSLLASMERIDQVQWLKGRGGMTAGTIQVELTLRGNRNDPIRIRDIRVESECSAPSPGTYLFLVPPIGATAQSIGMTLDASKPSESAWHQEAGESAEPYFPDRSITLKKDEQEQLVFALHAGDYLNSGARHQVCRAELEMAVIDDGKEVKQRIRHQGQPIRVMSYARTAEDISRYREVYLGGSVCKKFIPFHPKTDAEAIGYFFACPKEHQFE